MPSRSPYSSPLGSPDATLRLKTPLGSTIKTPLEADADAEDLLG